MGNNRYEEPEKTGMHDNLQQVYNTVSRILPMKPGKENTGKP